MELASKRNEKPKLEGSCFYAREPSLPIWAFELLFWTYQNNFWKLLLVNCGVYISWRFCICRDRRLSWWFGAGWGTFRNFKQRFSRWRFCGAGGAPSFCG